MTTHLTALAARLAKLAKDHPENVPTEMVELEVRRVIELLHMAEQGLIE